MEQSIHNDDEIQDMEPVKKLSPLDVRQALKNHPGWVVHNERLEKEYTFQNFARAMVF